MWEGAGQLCDVGELVDVGEGWDRRMMCGRGSDCCPCQMSTRQSVCYSSPAGELMSFWQNFNPVPNAVSHGNGQEFEAAKSLPP